MTINKLKWIKKYIWIIKNTGLNHLIHMDYVYLFMNFLMHQHYSGIHFQRMDRNLSGFN